MLNTPRVVIAILAATLITGCGIKKATHQKALDSLAACQTDLEGTKKDRDANAKKASDLEAELNATRVERDQKTAAEQKLITEMAATAEELTKRDARGPVTVVATLMPPAAAGEPWPALPSISL